MTSGPSVDLGTRERHKHGMGVEIGARVVSAGGVVMHEGAKVKAECILDAMLKLGILDGNEGGREDRKAVARSRHMAGERYRRLFEEAGLNQVRAMDLETKTQGGSDEMPDAVAQRRKEFNRVTSGLGAWAPTLQNVVCFNQCPTNAAYESETRRGLDRLCMVMKL